MPAAKRTTKQKREPQVLVAKTSGSTTVDGRDYNYVANVTRIDSDHPLARAVPENFEPAGERLSHVEQATAAPGEVRGG